MQRVPALPDVLVSHGWWLSEHGFFVESEVLHRLFRLLLESSKSFLLLSILFSLSSCSGLLSSLLGFLLLVYDFHFLNSFFFKLTLLGRFKLSLLLSQLGLLFGFGLQILSRPSQHWLDTFGVGCWLRLFRILGRSLVILDLATFLPTQGSRLGLTLNGGLGGLLHRRGQIGSVTGPCRGNRWLELRLSFGCLGNVLSLNVGLLLGATTSHLFKFNNNYNKEND